MALTQGRNTVEIANAARVVVIAVAASKVIYGGAMVALDSDGNAIPAIQDEDLIIVGRAEETVDNATGAAGAVSVKVKRGVFLWDNDSTAANKVTVAHLFQNCYVLDDCTVTSLATGSSVAGKVVGIYDDGIAVETL